MRPLTLKSHPDPYCLCQERRLFGPLGVEPQVEFEGPMFFFLYKSHWICGKGCFSGHHQSTYLWFGSTQDSARNLWNNMQWILQVCLSVSPFEWLEIYRNHLCQPLWGVNKLDLKEGHGLNKFYRLLLIFSTCWHQSWNPTNLQLISKLWYKTSLFSQIVYQLHELDQNPDYPTGALLSKYIYKVWSEHVRAIKNKCRIPFWSLKQEKTSLLDALWNTSI